MENLDIPENKTLLDYAIRKIMAYGFYDESGKYNVVLNQDNLKSLFKADVILLEERTKN